MMHAYSELYLSKAQVALGNMLHFAVYDLNEDISSFYRDFLNSGIAERFGKGDPKYTVGHSGVELAYEVIMKTRGEECTVKPEYHTDKTPEYWCGWALAYYQWYKDISFSRIEEIVLIEEVLRMYNPLHEADIKKFVITLDDLMEKRNKTSRLARLRAYARLTQKMLAEQSGVSVRMIEQYEQNKKNLSHASAETVYKLSKALKCKMEDLI